MTDTAPLDPPKPPHPVLAGIGRVIRTMFGLDLRSIALLRISMALCLLWVTYANGTELGAFYTDGGVLSRDMLIRHPPEFLGFSLYLAAGGMTVVTVLFLIQAALAVLLLVGYRTTLVTIGSYVMLLSMQNRNPVLMFGADIALRLGLFWMMFLPLGQRFSFDAALGRTRPSTTDTYLGIAGVAFFVQVALIYTIGSLMKIGPSWVYDHTAVSRALNLDVYSRPLGHWLNQFDSLTRGLTVFTLYAERYGPLLFILPVWNRWGRVLGLLIFTGLQVGFDLCMTMGAFGPIMVSLTLVFLPPEFWTMVAAPLGPKLSASASGVTRWWAGGAGAWWRIWRRQSLAAAEARFARPWRRSTARITLVLRGTRDAVVFGLMVLTILWNIGYVPGQPWRIPDALNRIPYGVGLNQVFDMFAPDPHTIDGWFVVAGTLRNGQVVDMINGGPATFEKPKDVAGSYGSMIWMSYLISFWYGSSDLETGALYLGHHWNEHHPADQQVQSVEINQMSYQTGLERVKPPAVRSILWTETF